MGKKNRRKKGDKNERKQRLEERRERLNEIVEREDKIDDEIAPRRNEELFVGDLSAELVNLSNSMELSNEETDACVLQGFLLEQRAAQCLIQGQIQQGFEAAGEATEVNPKSWRAWALRGEAACSFPEPHAHINLMMAVAVFEKALSLQPPDDGQELCQQRLEWARDMLGLDPSSTNGAHEDVSPLLDEAERLLSQGKTQDAFEKTQEATKRDPSSVRAWILQADALNALEDTLEINLAAEFVCLERALEIGVSNDEQRAELERRMSDLRRVVSKDAITASRDFMMLQGIPGTDRYRLVPY